MNDRLKVNLCGIDMDNPIIPASGTFGFGYEFAELYDINILGTFSFKGTTLHPRFGNPTPRIAECPSGMLNAVGLQNPGVDAVIAEELPKLKTCFSKPVMANVSGFSLDEYVEVSAKLDAEDQVGWIELNISCPNVHGGGMAFGTSAASAETVVRAVRDVVKKPLIVKLSPNVTDITEIARAVEAAGADGVSLINTLLGMRIDLRKKRPLLANTTGGYSGAAVFPVAVRMVYQVFKAVSIPVVGMGGVSSAKDVIEMMLAGATAVEIGAENLRNPFACRDIINALPLAMNEYRINTLNEIIGGAHEWEKM
ncbi:MAG: dihydroorotate dehydrogenase [Clostridia bacterium]|nr:dihydroorotate dehydrogenase [Clostridia bacterium]